MYAILAEDDSDADVLTNILRRHLRNDSLPVKRKGYGGTGGLCTKGARDIRTWQVAGITRFIICHDADGPDGMASRETVLARVARPAGVVDYSCITIPIQEIEAWIIADETAIARVIPSFVLKTQSNPEGISSPKEWLINQSKASNGKPLYSPKTFNAAVAKHLRLHVVQQKCPSFRQFLDCLTNKRP